MRVVGICGSLRAGSFNRALLEAAAAELPAGVEFHEWTGVEIPRWRRRFERSCTTWSTGRSHSPRD